jgi:hypothetical protein
MKTRVKQGTVNCFKIGGTAMGNQQIRPGHDPAAYEKLGNAIILQAVKDYRAALKTLKKNTRNITANRDRDDVERFFRSGWFAVLTTVDGEMLIRKLREEMAA